MKTSYRIAVSIIAALFILSCSKDESNVKEKAKVSLLKGKVEATTPATKTQHEFSDNSLKVRWNNDDEIAVSEGTGLYKFTQIGDISDDGHTALFASENPVSFEDGEIVAVYPYTTDLTYDLTSQTGSLDNLFQTDLLLARAQVSSFKIEDLAFKPLCAVIRFPTGIIVTDEDFSGDMKITVSGENVGGKVAISKTGGIIVQKEKITVTASIVNGKFDKDVYVVFVPREKNGAYSYVLDTERGDSYGFKIENITTTGIYVVKSVLDWFVVFEDVNFKNYCVEYFDMNMDGEVSHSEARAVPKMSFLTDNISSLKGIEAFKNLTYLQCTGTVEENNVGKLTSLDLSRNTKLDTIHCWNNQITTLDVSKCDQLVDLRCNSNQITELDLSNNKKLKYLTCRTNQISSLNISNCVDLEKLYCYENKLAELDLQNNVSLERLESYTNPLKKLDLSKNTELTYLNCGGNELTSLDLSKNTKMTNLHCAYNSITSLDLANNTKLEKIYCYLNNITQLNLTKNKRLTYLCAWPQNTNVVLSKIWITKGTGVKYYNRDYVTINPSNYGTTIIEMY